MSTLIRNDGAVFLIQVYRDQLKAQKARRMRDKLRRLSEQQGRYVQIFSDKKGEIEVCFDKNVGFLLGESIARHFRSEAHFIYIEQMHKTGKSLVIVVKDRRVQLDTLISHENIWSELLPFLAEETAYHLFHAGFDDRLPFDFSSKESANRLMIKMVSEARALPKTLFESLPLDPSLQLIPCEKAIQQSNFSGMSGRIAMGAALILLVVIAIMLSIDWAREDQKEQAAWQLPYAGYYRGVSAEPASEVLARVNDALSQVYELPTLEIQRLDYHGQQLEISFMGEQDKLEPLLNWAKSNNYRFSLHSGTVKLIQQASFKPVDLGNKIYSTTEIYAYLSDQLHSIRPDSTFRLSSSSQEGKHWQNLTCEWQVADLTPMDLDWLRRLLLQAPVTCDRLALSYHDGAIRGTIQLKIWGTQ
jgi:hypothetical protein